jgi:hypothetical protein
MFLRGLIGASLQSRSLIVMNTISFCIHVEKEPAICAKCGSAVWIARDLCLGCMLVQGIGADGQSSRTLDDLLSEIDIDENGLATPQSRSRSRTKR